MYSIHTITVTDTWTGAVVETINNARAIPNMMAMRTKYAHQENRYRVDLSTRREQQPVD